MKITELLTADRILLDITASTKEEVWDVLAQTFEKTGAVLDRAGYLSDVEKRETLGTTGVGFGVAIPHAKSAAVLKPALAFARVTQALDVQSLDGTKADLFFLIAAPLNGEDVHLQALSRLARMLMHEDFLAALRNANSAEEIQAALQTRE
jgi:fructose-specific phosphotransferase system IIA component